MDTLDTGDKGDTMDTVDTVVTVVTGFTGGNHKTVCIWEATLARPGRTLGGLPSGASSLVNQSLPSPSPTLRSDGQGGQNGTRREYGALSVCFRGKYRCTMSVVPAVPVRNGGAEQQQRPQQSQPMSLPSPGHLAAAFAHLGDSLNCTRRVPVATVGRMFSATPRSIPFVLVPTSLSPPAHSSFAGMSRDLGRLVRDWTKLRERECAAYMVLSGVNGESLGPGAGQGAGAGGGADADLASQSQYTCCLLPDSDDAKR